MIRQVLNKPAVYADDLNHFIWGELEVSAPEMSVLGRTLVCKQCWMFTTQFNL